jgi:hypothetical protein
MARKKTLKADKGAVTVKIKSGVKTYTTKDGKEFKTMHEAKAHLHPDWIES